MIAQNNKENEQSRVFVASHFLLATRNYHLSSQILLYLCKTPRSRQLTDEAGIIFTHWWPTLFQYKGF